MGEQKKQEQGSHSLTAEFIPYELALALKKLGFNKPCFGRWLVITEWEEPAEEIRLQIGLKVEDYSKNQCAAPLYQQAFRWFREKYKIGTWIHHYFDMDKGNFQYSWIITLPYKDDGYVYETHEEAEFECLKKLIEIVEHKQILNKFIEKWWDNLNIVQQNWLSEKFFKEDEHGINTLEKVIYCYDTLSEEERLILSGLNN